MRRRVLVPFGATWRYRHVDGPPPAGWTGAPFDDASWLAGRAPLGYNTIEDGTRIYPGSSFKRRPASAQFRHAFSLAPGEMPTGPLTLAVHRTSGLRVHLNGRLAAWDGVPWPEVADDVTTGVFSNSDTARYPLQFSIPSRMLQPGPNVLAVDLRHAQRQYGALAFDVSLACGDAPLDRIAFAASVTSAIPTAITVGAAAPDFEWLDVRTRERHRLAEYFGKPFLLQFSGAECRPCWKKLPIIRRWADAGLACLSISSWGTIEDMAGPAARHEDLLAGIVVGAEPRAYDSHQTACYRRYGIFNGTILVGADGRVLALATGFTLDEYVEEVRVIDGVLRSLGYAFDAIPERIGVVGGPDDWRVVSARAAYSA